MQLTSLVPAVLEGSLLARLVTAAVLGGLIGFERDKRGRAAGLRTHLLVSLGSALFTLISVEVADLARAGGSTTADPGRISAQIVSGIGFLGAGAIVKEGLTIRGLTTAACLWTVAAIGLAAGSGAFELAVIVTIISLASLVFLNRLERVYDKDSYRSLEVVTDCSEAPDDVLALIEAAGMDVLYMDLERDLTRNVMTLTYTLRWGHRDSTDAHSIPLVQRLESSNLGITRIQWYKR